ncbi:30S ribosomal protein S9 [archaeon]|jgi:small subunit ribosomal protein S9|nr:30S ribosomal protein S9 [archaeon]
MNIENKYKKIIVSGKRKRAVAKATLIAGTGKITINDKEYQSIQPFDVLRIREPLEIAKAIIGKTEFDVKISVRGGGEKSQIDAARLALARAIVEFTGSKELEQNYIEYDRSLLVADVRRKEAYKPGDSKARSKRQSSKR